METMRQSWTDDRMDDLSRKVDRVDDDVRALRLETRTEFKAVRAEMKEGFDKVDERFDKVDARFEKMDERFQAMDARLIAMYRMMFGFCATALVALIGLFGTQL